MAEYGDITDYEKEIVESGKVVTRIEIQVRSPKKTLKDVADDPASLVSYFDKIEFYNFEDNGIIAGMGGLQILMSKVRREHRKAFETFKDEVLRGLLRDNFIKSITEFFEAETYDNIPF